MDRSKVVKAAAGRLFDASTSTAEVAREAAETGVLDAGMRASLNREVRRIMAVLHVAQLIDTSAVGSAPPVSDEELFDVLRNPHRLEVRLSWRRPEEPDGGALP